MAKTLERNIKKPRKKGEYLKFVNHVKEDEKGQKASVGGRGLFVTSTFSRREKNTIPIRESRHSHLVGSNKTGISVRTDDAMGR